MHLSSNTVIIHSSNPFKQQKEKGIYRSGWTVFSLGQPEPSRPRDEFGRLQAKWEKVHWYVVIWLRWLLQNKSSQHTDSPSSFCSSPSSCQLIKLPSFLKQCPSEIPIIERTITLFPFFCHLFLQLSQIPQTLSCYGHLRSLYFSAALERPFINKSH